MLRANPVVVWKSPGMAVPWPVWSSYSRGLAIPMEMNIFQCVISTSLVDSSDHCLLSFSCAPQWNSMYLLCNTLSCFKWLQLDFYFTLLFSRLNKNWFYEVFKNFWSTGNYMEFGFIWSSLRKISAVIIWVHGNGQAVGILFWPHPCASAFTLWHRLCQVS